MEWPPVHPSPCQLEGKILRGEGARRERSWAGLGWALPGCAAISATIKPGDVLLQEGEEDLPSHWRFSIRSWSRGCPVKAKHSPGTTVTTFPWGTSIMGCLSLGTSGRRSHGLNTKCSPKAPVNAGIFRGKLIRL